MTLLMAVLSILYLVVKWKSRKERNLNSRADFKIKKRF
jgi:hypothetical protein